MCVYVVYVVIFEKTKFNTSVKLPKGGFTRVKNSTRKQKSNIKAKPGLFTNVSTIFTWPIKQRSHAINFVFSKKFYNVVIVR